MSFEAVSNIKKAEEDAERLVAEAETQARQIISDAENSGRAKKEAAEKKAAQEKEALLKETEAQIDKENEISGNETSKTLEAQRSIASGKINTAAQIVAERILED